MNCRDSQDLMQQHLDGLELTDRAALELHLGSCLACRSAHTAAGRLQQGLRLLTLPAPPDGLAEQIAGRWLAERESGSNSGGACCLRQPPWLSWAWTSRPGSGGSQPVRESIGPGMSLGVMGTGSSRLPKTGEPTVCDSVSEVGSIMVSAATRTADATLAESRRLLPLVPSPQLPSLQVPPMLEPATQPLREVGQGVSEVLAPVADSARRAVDLFLRDLPPMNLDEKPGL